MAQSEGLHIEYGTTLIPFLLTYRNRKTLGITVTPDKQVAISAPVGAGLEKILEQIGKRAGWICKQIRKFESYEENLSHRKLQYVGGETIYYLGRKYRLKLVEGREESVQLRGRYLKMIVQNKLDEAKIATLLMNWYRQEAKKTFRERFERYKYILKRERISVNGLMVRRLKKRWGSCTENGNILLNLSLVQAPVQCIDYVLVHELCHLKYMDHGIKFYGLLRKYMENWQKIKERLQTVSLLE